MMACMVRVSMVSMPSTAAWISACKASWLMLLGLPLGDLGRDDLLRLLVHPAVQSGISEADPQQCHRSILAGRLAEGATVSIDDWR